ncbi:MAG TPA: ASCH domain-containing protein [Cellulomonas sp.]
MTDDEDAARAIDQFWQVARVKARLSTLGGVLGETPAATVAPQAWAFGDSPELADELLDLVLAGTKTATAELAWNYEAAHEPLPAPRDLSIVLDGAGAPRALLRTTKVDVVPFSSVTAEHARLEGEGDGTLESWRADHERYWRRNMPAGREFSGDAPVICERFTLVFPKP